MGTQEDQIEALRRQVAHLEEALRTLQDAQREGAEEYRAVVETSGEAIFTMDESGTYLFMNSTGAERFHGMPADFVGKTMWDLFPPEIADRQVEWVRQVIRSGKGTVVDTWTEVLGQMRWYRTSIEPLRSDRQGVRAALVVARDVTEFRLAQEALQESEEKYRAVVESAGDAISVVDARGVFLYLNRTGAQDLGGRPGDFIGKTMWEVFPPHLADRQIRMAQEVIRTGKGISQQGLTQTRGQPRWYHLNVQPIRDRTGTPTAVVVVARDITEQKQAEELAIVQRDLGTSLAAESSLKGALTQCVNLAIRVSGMDCGGVYVVDEVGDLKLICSQGLSSRFGAEVSSYGRESPRWQLVMAGKPAYARYADLGFGQEDWERKEKLASLAVIPVLHQGRVIACLHIGSHVLEEVPSASQRMLEAIAAQIGNVIIRLQAEESLWQGRAELQALFDSLQDYLFVLDERGRILRVNQMVLNDLGYSCDELLSMDAPQLHPPDRRQEAAEVLADVLAGKRDLCTVPLMTKGRRLIPVETKITRSKWGDKTVLFGVSRDISSRLRAEQELRRTTEVLQTLIQASPLAIVAIDREKRVLLWSPAAQRLFGWSREEVLGKPLPTVPPDRQEEFHGLVREAFAGADRIDVEVTRLRKDGTRLDVSLSSAQLLDENAQAIGVMAVFTDITARKRATEELRASEERLRAILSSLHETFIVVFDRPGRFTSVWAPEGLLERYGVSREAIFGRLVLDAFPTEQGRKRMDMIRHVFETGQSVRGEFSVRRLEGEYWTEATYSPMRGPHGEVIAAVGVIRDITQRKAAEIALAESEHRYRTLVENVNFGVFRTTAELPGRFLQTNPAVVKMHGYDSIEELMRIPVAEIYAEPSTRRGLLDKLARQGFLQDEEVHLRRKDGTVFWGSITAKANYDEGGTICWLDGVIEDITDRKQAEEALRQAHDKLVNAREEERRYLASELHDSIGQGLVALQLALQSGAGTVPPDGAELARGLAGAVQTCKDLIREVRNISHGLYPPTLESLGLVSALRQLVDYCETARVAAALHSPGELKARRFDIAVEIALFRIAQEAVNNALRHGKARHIELDLWVEKRRIILSVRDDGRGFDVHGNANGGLGLTMMKDRAHAVGGELVVTSRPGQTVVEARLPARPRQTARRGKPKAL